MTTLTAYPNTISEGIYAKTTNSNWRLRLNQMDNGVGAEPDPEMYGVKIEVITESARYKGDANAERVFEEHDLSTTERWVKICREGATYVTKFKIIGFSQGDYTEGVISVTPNDYAPEGEEEGAVRMFLQAYANWCYNSLHSIHLERLVTTETIKTDKATGEELERTVVKEDWLEVESLYGIDFGTDDDADWRKEFDSMVLDYAGSMDESPEDAEWVAV